jgi:hypothetical protein
LVSNGVSNTASSLAKGFITGSTDGKRSKTELRISNANNPKSEIVISNIISDEDIYIKGPATGQKWWKTSEEGLDEMNGDTPMDASLFGFYYLGTLFEESDAVFKSVGSNNIRFLGEEKYKDRTVLKYSAEIAVPSFINAVSQNEDLKDDVEDLEKILEDTTMDGTFYVDPETYYIVYMDVSAKNVTQIITPEAERFGLRAVHDINFISDLSRFNLENTVSIPDESEIEDAPVRANEDVLGVSIEAVDRF